MKSPYYYLLAFIFLMACQNKTPQTNENKIITNKCSNENNEITIKYSKPINGYNVSVKWMIKGKLNNVNGSDNLSGPAILTFEKISTKEISWVIHPEFTIAIDKENLNKITFKDGDFVKNRSFTQISNYTKPKFKRVGTSKEEEGYGYTYIPFFFQDVDFDDKDELILTYATIYGKGGSTNKIFKITDYNGVKFSEMTNEPFTSFRGFYFGNPSADHYGYTIINYNRKSITHSGLVGAGGQYSSIYEFKKSEYGGGYQLYKKTEINLNMVGYGRTDGTIAYYYDDNGEVLSINKMKSANDEVD